MKAIETSEMSALVRRNIEELPPLLREILVLCEFEELSYQAAATITQVPLENGTITFVARQVATRSIIAR